MAGDGGGVALTAVILVAFVLASFHRPGADRAAAEPAVRIEVTAQPWWWDVRYQDPVPSPRVDDRQRDPHPGRPAGGADAHLERRDPQLLGAEPARQEGPDPGRERRSTSRPTAPAFRGQCAEFCGLSTRTWRCTWSPSRSEEFERWQAQQRGRAAEPAMRSAEGREVFLSQPCVMCHAIRGTPAAAGRAGPDPPRQPPHARGRHPAQHARAPRRLDRRSAAASSPATTCRPTCWSPTSSRRCSLAYLETLK